MFKYGTYCDICGALIETGKSMSNLINYDKNHYICVGDRRMHVCTAHLKEINDYIDSLILRHSDKDITQAIKRYNAGGTLVTFAEDTGKTVNDAFEWLVNNKDKVTPENYISKVTMETITKFKGEGWLDADIAASAMINAQRVTEFVRYIAPIVGLESLTGEMRVALVADLIDGSDITELSKLYNVSENAVLRFATKVCGLEYTNIDISEIVGLFNSGVSIEALAQKMNKSLIETRIWLLKHSETVIKPHLITKEVESIIKAEKEAGTHNASIARKLGVVTRRVTEYIQLFMPFPELEASCEKRAEMVKLLKDGICSNDVADKLKLPAAIVYDFASTLVSPVYDLNDVEYWCAKNAADDGASIRDIAEDLGCCVTAVDVALMHKQEPRASQQTPYTDTVEWKKGPLSRDERAQIVKLITAGKSVEEISEATRRSTKFIEKNFVLPKPGAPDANTSTESVKPIIKKKVIANSVKERVGKMLSGGDSIEKISRSTGLDISTVRFIAEEIKSC